jgi:hypothetical protein
MYSQDTFPDMHYSQDQAQTHLQNRLYDTATSIAGQSTNSFNNFSFNSFGLVHKNEQKENILLYSSTDT